MKMLHKISQMCDKIDSIKQMSDTLRKMKYEQPKATDAEIDNMIAQIQSDCYVVSQDKSAYAKDTKKKDT